MSTRPRVELRNQFLPFAGDDVEVADDGGGQPTEPTCQPCWSDEVEPIEFEDDDNNEPEELKRQKSCEAPTHRQRQEHIDSNHATYRGWCDICIKARATGTPHRTIKQDEQARKDAEKDGPRIDSEYFYMSNNEKSMPHLALKFSRSGRLSAIALPAKGATEFGVK